MDRNARAARAQSLFRKAGGVYRLADLPPLAPCTSRFSGALYAQGIETHERDGVMPKVHGAARTVADCFRLRNRLGSEVALEALRTGLEERTFTPAEILRAAQKCRVAGIVRPYLEALQ